MSDGPAIRGEIRSLTGIRGLAASFVVVYHALHASSPLTDLVLGRGYLCVDLFFVLSGYVMALNYAKLFSGDGTTWSNYFSFLGMRFARLYPLYFVTVVVAMMFGVLGIMPLYFVPDLGVALGWNAVMMQAWSFGAGSINLAAWSISTEWSAYLVFPLLVAFIFSGSSAKAWIAAAIAMAGLVVVIALGPSVQDEIEGPLAVFGTNTPLPVLRCVASFVLGMVVFRLEDGSFGRWLASRNSHGDVLAALAVVLFFWPQADLLFVAVCALLIAHLAKSDSRASWLLGTEPVYYLGQISYSLYLVHAPILFLLRTTFLSWGWSWNLANLLTIVVSFALAPFAYHYIEVPGRRALRAMFARRTVSA